MNSDTFTIDRFDIDRDSRRINLDKYAPGFSPKLPKQVLSINHADNTITIGDVIVKLDGCMVISTEFDADGKATVVVEANL
jgi:hypothetical protein